MNRVGNKIRFRRKKKEKLKTENRARKALKTISLILGKYAQKNQLFSLDLPEGFFDFNTS